jgi:hypothetical protein
MATYSILLTLRVWAEPTKIKTWCIDLHGDTSDVLADRMTFKSFLEAASYLEEVMPEIQDWARNDNVVIEEVKLVRN